MTLRLPTPRLLPATICLLAMVLATKSTNLVRAVIIAVQPAALITAAWASGPEATAEKPAAKSAAKPEHAADKKPVPEPPAAENKPPVIDAPPVTDGERAVLMELRDRRHELDARETSLSARESILTAAETKLSARVEQLQGLQKKLEGLDANHRQQEDAAWKGLVKVYEDMKPRDAATIFNDLGMQVLLAIVDRMKEAKAAAILASMDPDKARNVTMQLALSRSHATNTVENGDKPTIPSTPGKPPGSGT